MVVAFDVAEAWTAAHEKRIGIKEGRRAVVPVAALSSWWGGPSRGAGA